MSDLTLRQISETNRARSQRWHKDCEPWGGADWSNAMCGEAGEAANVVKKLRRLETSKRSSGEYELQMLLAALGDELADTILYLDLLADHYGIDLPAAICRKFNRVSERQGFPERLPVEVAR